MATLTPRTPSLVQLAPPCAVALGVGVLAALASLLPPWALDLVRIASPRAPILVHIATDALAWYLPPLALVVYVACPDVGLVQVLAWSLQLAISSRMPLTCVP